MYFNPRWFKIKTPIENLNLTLWKANPLAMPHALN